MLNGQRSPQSPFPEAPVEIGLFQGKCILCVKNVIAIIKSQIAVKMRARAVAGNHFQTSRAGAPEFHRVWVPIYINSLDCICRFIKGAAFNAINNNRGSLNALSSGREKIVNDREDVLALRGKPSNKI